MTYLLDTHVLLWWFDNPKLLSREARDVISDAQTLVHVSSVSAWEIVIKKSLGKLKVSDRIFFLIEENFTELPVTIAHAQELAALPPHHADPFDRLLIAQARYEEATLITRDKQFEKYGIPLINA
jgi:PIN domain nuclease of toxin-antitoxin system